MESKTRSGKKIILAAITLAITVTVIAVFYFRPTKIAEEIIPPRKSPPQLSTTDSTASPTSFSQTNDQNLTQSKGGVTQSNDRAQSEILLKAPFTPQAPTANWDQLHNEACEEAAAIMADAYFNNNNDNNNNNRSTLDPKRVEAEIAKLTQWQDEHFGYHLDTTSAETAEMIEKVYGLHTKLITDFSEDDIKAELNQDHLVIISENGRLLGNPNYKRPGPIHHMLLVKGYTTAQLVTNDPGTRKGLSYPYDFSTIYTAAADWSHAAGSVDSGKKIAIVVWE